MMLQILQLETILEEKDTNLVSSLHPSIVLPSPEVGERHGHQSQTLALRTGKPATLAFERDQGRLTGKEGAWRVRET